MACHNCNDDRAPHRETGTSAAQPNASSGAARAAASGQTTLAYEICRSLKSVYLDLESPRDRERLSDPLFYLGGHADKLVVLDEVQRQPNLFAALRGLIDEGRRTGSGNGRFLLLGSASMELLQQTETLAGRIAYLELSPFDVLEVASDRQGELWVKGGFPKSFLAADDSESLLWRRILLGPIWNETFHNWDREFRPQL
jgi:predicted AAA+ superfamily ATPase